MFYSLNPILKDHKSNFNPTNYIHGTYRMKFIRSKVDSEGEENSPIM